MEKYTNHYKESVFIAVSPENIFAYADDHKHFSSHMNTSSWMMGGGKMETKTDEGQGQKVGSHITMSGEIFGINLFLDEVITVHEPPHKKAWETVGNLNLLVIDHYKLGFVIQPENNGSRLTVFIDYNLPQSPKTRILGILLGDMYAKWCVRQMVKGVASQFNQ